MMRVCGFCGIEESRAEALFLGSNATVCDACVESCMDPADAACFDSSNADNLAIDISDRMKWGPINCGSAIRAKFCCEYCGKRMLSSVDNYHSWEIDHIIPGGGDTLQNCALACHTCNHLKHRYVPTGNTRTELIADSRHEIDRLRTRKLAELQKLRSILGLPSLIGG